MKTLVVLLGPTGVGKTETSFCLAEALRSPIISADSRQIYREIPIGTAAPTPEEQARVKHYFVGTHSVSEDYNAGQYERDCLKLIDQLFQTHDTLLMVGGAMMYIDAVCYGLDDIPSATVEMRQAIQKRYEQDGIAWLQAEVKRLDPEYAQEVDMQNPQRLVHAIEVCMASGKPYSSFRSGRKKERDFRIIRIGLNRPRPELYERINSRVAEMMAQGLEAEARSVYPLREYNSLNTVGYKEMFAYFDGQCTLDEAISMIQQNSRHYAKRQLTWFLRDKSTKWFEPQDTDKILDYVQAQISFE